jgi:hypothetical protein
MVFCPELTTQFVMGSLKDRIAIAYAVSNEVAHQILACFTVNLSTYFAVISMQTYFTLVAIA